MDHKVCKTCNAEKPLADYHRRRSTRRDKQGQPYIYEHVSATCKACEHGTKTAWRKTPEGKASERQFRQTNEKHKAWAQTPTGKESIRRYRSSLRNLLLQSCVAYKTRGGTGPVTLTEDELEQILERYQMTCAYCRRVVDRAAEVGHPTKLTLDHIIPLDRGGGHTHENVVPACWRCNERKGLAALTPLPPPPIGAVSGIQTRS